jgi:DNA polymerase-3 subunit delta'
MQDEAQPRHPALRGHAAFLEKFAEQARSGRLAHGWLLAGPSGIGKARVAQTLAAWLLAGGAEQHGLLENQITAGEILAGLQGNPQARLVLSGAHPDLLLIRPEASEQNKSGQIKADQLRRISAFLSQTAGRGGWRAVILDSLDEVNRNGANALLKILEEPPERTVLFCLSGKPGSVLATIRSRCQLARLHPLGLDDTRAVLADYWPEAEADTVLDLARLSGGAPGRAVLLAEAGAADLFAETCSVIAGGQGAAAFASLCSRWGPGGAKGRAMRQSALFLFEQLFAHAARIAAGGQQPDWPDFAVAALRSLSNRHSSGQLADMHRLLLHDLQEAETRYLDFGAVLHQFFFKIHSQTPASQAM